MPASWYRFIPSTKTLGLAFACFASGVVFAEVFSSPIVSALMFAAALWAAFFMLGFRPKAFHALMAVFIAGVFMSLFLQTKTPKVFEESFGNLIEGEAKVVLSEPRDLNARLVLHVQKGEEEGKIVVFAPSHMQLSRGDIVSFSGTLSLPESFETDTGRIFDYPAYLKSKGITAEIKNPKLEKIGTDRSLLDVMYLLKLKASRSLERNLHEPHAALSQGVLLGEKKAIPEKVEENLIRAGLIHIAVLSGYNITIVALFFRRLSSPLGLKGSLTAALIGVALFVMFVGPSATVVRAGLMGSLGLIALFHSRSADALRLLLVAGFIMVCIEPAILLHDPSFQLSFLATFGLITLSVPIMNRLTFVPDKLGLREIVAATVATQATVLPLLAYISGKVSLYGLLANILVVPMVPLLMLAALCTALVSFIPVLNFLPAFTAAMLSGWIVSVSALVSALPFSSVQVPEINPVVIAGFYLTLFVALIFYSERSRAFE